MAATDLYVKIYRCQYDRNMSNALVRRSQLNRELWNADSTRNNISRPGRLGQAEEAHTGSVSPDESRDTSTLPVQLQ